MSLRTLSFAAALTCSCAVEPTVGTAVHRDGARSSLEDEEEEAPPRLVTMTRDGALALLDLDVGAELSRVALPPGTSVDLVVVGTDAAPVVAVRVTTEEDVAGDLYLVTVSPEGALGPPEHVVPVLGASALVPTPRGVVVAQEDLGERWRLFSSDGVGSASLACGRPLSLRPLPGDAGIARFEALTLWPDKVLSSAQVLVGEDGVSACRPVSLVGAEEASDSVRLVELGVGWSRALVDVRGGELVVSALDAFEVASEARVPLPSARVEATARASLRPGRAGLAVLTSEPARLALLELGLGPGELAILERYVVDLPGEVERAERRPGRSLVVTTDRALVATSTGVLAFDLGRDGPRRDATFEGSEYRAPIVRLEAP